MQMRSSQLAGTWPSCASRRSAWPFWGPPAAYWAPACCRTAMLLLVRPSAVVPAAALLYLADSRQQHYSHHAMQSCNVSMLQLPHRSTSLHALSCVSAGS